MKKILLAICLLALFPASAPALECPAEPSLPRELHEALFEANKLMSQDKLAESARLLAAYAKEHPDSDHHRLAFMQGMLAYQQGDSSRALQCLERAVGLYPCYGLAWRNLAILQYENKLYLKAAESALQAYALSEPPEEEYVYQAAVFYLEGGKQQKALDILKRLCAQEKVKPAWLKALVRAHLTQKQWKEAGQAARRLLKMLPEDAEVWRLAAGVELRRQRYRQAAADLEVAFRLKPATPAECKQMAELYRAAGLPKPAAAWYMEAVGAKPGPADWEMLANIHRQAGLLEQAIFAAEKAMQKPSSARCLLLADLHLQKRQYGQAAEYFAQAGRLGNNGKHYLQAGQCAWQNEELEKAMAYLHQALELCKPDSAPYKQSKSLLDDLERYQRELMAQNTGEHQYE